MKLFKGILSESESDSIQSKELHYLILDWDRHSTYCTLSSCGFCILHCLCGLWDICDWAL